MRMIIKKEQERRAKRGRGRTKKGEKGGGKQEKGTGKRNRRASHSFSGKDRM
jgi:hypothetical protein